MKRGAGIAFSPMPAPRKVSRFSSTAAAITRGGDYLCTRPRVQLPGVWHSPQQMVSVPSPLSVVVA